MAAEHLHESLGLDDVARRFSESADMLDRVARQLEALRDAESRALASGQSLASAATGVSEFALAAKSAADGLKSATEMAGRALEAAASILQDRESDQLKRLLQELSKEQDSRFRSLESHLTEGNVRGESGFRLLSDQVRVLDSRVEQLAALQDSQLRRDLDARTQELERVKSVLSWRQKRKLGV